MERAVVFVDGNNWYQRPEGRWPHRPRLAQLRQGIGQDHWRSRLDRHAVLHRPGAPRGNPTLYADQRRYMAWTCVRDKRISVHYGRLEERPEENRLARELKHYLGELTVRIEPAVYKDLLAMAKRHDKTTVVVEKAVDVMIAVDLIQMAIRDEYDVAYLLSADGDYTPAAEAVKVVPGKKVFAASLRPGAELAKAVYKFIPLQRDWFSDCFGE